MTRPQDLDKLSHAIKDAEARLKVFTQTLETIQKELDALAQVERAIEENVNFLKKKHIIALAQEFKKAKDDLAKTRIRMVKVRIDRDNIIRASREVEEYLRKSKDDYAASLIGPNNVLTFGRKNAKE